MNSLDMLNIEKLESRLRLERKELLDRIQAQLHRSDDPQQLALANHLSEVDDWAIADLQGDIDIAILGHELSGLRDIDVALKRIADGSYGTCASCNDQIDQNRLHVQPTARLCLACKLAFEKRRGIVTHSV